MKAELSHSPKSSTANYIFFGITLSVFLSSLFFSILQNRSDLYSGTNVTALLSQRAAQPVITTLTEVEPINLKKFLSDVAEEPIVIENWMTDTEWTAISSTTLSTYIHSEAVEEAIPLEDWMMSTASWTSVPKLDIIEESLPLQSWMLDISTWEVINQAAYFNENTIVEADIPLEAWMLSADAWSLNLSEDYTEAHIPIESWMLSTDSWSTIEALNTTLNEEDIPLESWMLDVSTWEVVKSQNLASN